MNVTVSNFILQEVHAADVRREEELQENLSAWRRSVHTASGSSLLFCVSKSDFWLIYREHIMTTQH